MNIYEKLVEVRKAVPYLKKDNAGFQFKFVSSSQTLGSLRDAMDAQGLLLIPRVISTEVRDHTTRKGDHEYFSIFNMSFTWVNAEKPEETVECTWCGHGLDDGEKGVGKALTYAEKYFLLKFFNIATDKDDPDSFQKKDESKGTPPPKQEQKVATPEGQRDLRAEISAMLLEICHTEAACQAQLKILTTFEVKDKDTGEPKMVYYTDPARVSEKSLKIVYGKVKAWYEKMMGATV